MFNQILDNWCESHGPGSFVQDARIQDLYFNISEIKVSITLQYIISDAPKYDNFWTENSDVIDSFVSEILKYKSSVIVSSTEKAWAVLFTPKKKVSPFYCL